MVKRSSVPECTVKRLCIYLRQLERLDAEGIEKISSGKLAGMLHVTDAQIRKDVGYFGQFGRPGFGYRVRPLIGQLRRILGTDQTRKVIVVGAGDLSQALLRHGVFLERGFDLVATFDIAPGKAGKRAGRASVRHLRGLPKVVRTNDVRLAIITVPAEAAQSVVDLLCRAGITGILSLVPASLRAPPGVAVSAVDLTVNMEQLCFQVDWAKPAPVGGADHRPEERTAEFRAFKVAALGRRVPAARARKGNASY